MRVVSYPSKFWHWRTLQYLLRNRPSYSGFFPMWKMELTSITLKSNVSLADHLHAQEDMWDKRKRRLKICEDCVDSGWFQNMGNGDDIHHLEIDFGHADHLHAQEDIREMRKRRLKTCEHICEDWLGSRIQNVGNGVDITHLEIEFGLADHLHVQEGLHILRSNGGTIGDTTRRGQIGVHLHGSSTTIGGERRWLAIRSIHRPHVAHHGEGRPMCPNLHPGDHIPSQLPFLLRRRVPPLVLLLSSPHRFPAAVCRHLNPLKPCSSPALS